MPVHSFMPSLKPNLTLSMLGQDEFAKKVNEGLSKNEFVVHYQPIINLFTGRIDGMEALVRWVSPTGLISPAEFIPMAEETGLIVPLGNTVLRTACTQAQEWRKKGYTELCLSVNLSAKQFQQAALLKTLRDTLQETQLPADCLELEITESHAMGSAQLTVSILQNLKAMGVRLAIDDFGTGYSSLSYLTRFPLNTLKIDRSFVKDLMTDPNDVAIVKAMVGLAHALKLEVVAEGVETQEQLDKLREFGCNRMQGFFFSKPVDAKIFESYLQSHKAL